MQVGKLIAVWLPIALGIVMIGAGAVNFVGASAKPGARLDGNMIGPCDEGDLTGRGQPVKSAFDPLEPIIDIPLNAVAGPVGALRQERDRP